MAVSKKDRAGLERLISFLEESRLKALKRYEAGHVDLYDLTDDMLYVVCRLKDLIKPGA